MLRLSRAKGGSKGVGAAAVGSERSAGKSLTWGLKLLIPEDIHTDTAEDCSRFALHQMSRSPALSAGTRGFLRDRSCALLLINISTVSYLLC